MSNKITVVVPTLNVANYLPFCLDSIFSQNHDNLECIIIDGGSTDGTIDVIRQYEYRLAYWVSEPDSGIYDAVQKGFARSTGDIMAWLGGDDVYLPGALSFVSSSMERHPQIRWITSRTSMIINENGHVVRVYIRPGVSRVSFLDACHTTGIVPYGIAYIQQESTFWRRSLWQQAGARMNQAVKMAGDFELWSRFFSLSEIHTTIAPLSCFRIRKGQTSRENIVKYGDETAKILQFTVSRLGHKIEPTPNDGYRRYIGKEISESGIMKWPFIFIDQSVDASGIKAIIQNNAIG